MVAQARTRSTRILTLQAVWFLLRQIGSSTRMTKPVSIADTGNLPITGEA